MAEESESISEVTKPVVQEYAPVDNRMGLGDLLNIFGNSQKTDFSFRVFNICMALLIIGLVVLVIWMYQSRLPCISSENLDEFHEWCKVKDLGLERVSPRVVGNTTIRSHGYR